jgi:transcription elongation factor Elf1
MRKHKFRCPDCRKLTVMIDGHTLVHTPAGMTVVCLHCEQEFFTTGLVNKLHIGGYDG